MNRSLAASDLPSRRTPRLGVRFLLVTAIGLAAAGAGILVVVERTLASQAERQAIDHAKTTATEILDRRIRATDLTAALSPARRRQLGVWFAPAQLGTDALGATLYPATGAAIVNSSSAPPSTARLLKRAAAGTGISTITQDRDREVLRTLLPVRVGHGRGVLEIDQDYGRISRAARHTAYTVAAILEALLLGLCLLLLPTLTRASTRLRRQLEQLDHVASHDELTGLLNRAGFRRALAEELAAPRARGAIVLIDVDRFHEINESLGPEEGDRLLVEIANRLRAGFPDCPHARLGEDEFALLLADATSAGVDAATASIAGLFSRPFPVEPIQLAVDIRVGAACYPGHGADAETLLRHASIALTHARQHIERVSIYHDEYEETDLARLALVTDIRQALRLGHIVVHYQPQVSLLSGRVRAVEALVRWQHPTRGLLSAGQFIDAAEQSSVISELGRQVLTTSIRQWRTWHEQGITLDVAVNLSAVDLLDVTLPSAIVELLLEQQMPAGRLVLEITERTLLGHESKSNRVLRQLQRIGASLSIDDYGTGYSSLATLRALPVGQLKIDRCFVSGLPDDPTSDKIVESTIQLAHALGTTVVAEGVETEAQLRRLALLGCDTVQGYLPGKPQTAEQLSALLKQRGATDTHPRRSAHLAVIPR